MSKPRVEIEYCSKCRFILRATWMAQEILMTFVEEIGEVALKPGGNGIFVIRLDGEVMFARSMEDRFPESKEIKQLIRNRIAPDKSLGHSDN